MMNGIVFSFLLLVAAQTVKCEDIDQNGDVPIAGTNDKCAQFCSDSFAAKDAAIKSCQQGCRLYTILHFVRGGPSANSQADASAVTDSCKNQCDKAYTNGPFKDACIEGCKHQSPITTEEVKVVVDEGTPTWSFLQNILPHQVTQKFSDVSDFLSSSFSNIKNWFQNEPVNSFAVDNTEIKNDEKSQDPFDFAGPEFKDLFDRMTADSGEDVIDKLLSDIGFDRSFTSGRKDFASPRDDMFTNPLLEYAKSLAPMPNFEQPRPVLNNEDNEPVVVVKITADVVPDNVDESPFESNFEGDQDVAELMNLIDNNFNEKELPPSTPVDDSSDNWMTCWARRSQNWTLFTRGLLILALILSIMCMVHFCLVAVRARRRRRRERELLQCKLDSLIKPPPSSFVFAEAGVQPPGYTEKYEQPATPPPSYETAANPIAVKTSEVAE